MEEVALHETEPLPQLPPYETQIDQKSGLGGVNFVQRLLSRGRSGGDEDEAEHSRGEHQVAGGGAAMGTEHSDDVIISPRERSVSQSDDGEGAELGRGRAPTLITSGQIEKEIADDMNEIKGETASYAVYSITPGDESPQGNSSSTLLSVCAGVRRLAVERCDTMSLSMLERVLKKLTSTVEDAKIRRERGGSAKKININQFPLDVRYKVEREIIPAIAERYKAFGGVEIELYGELKDARVAAGVVVEALPPSFHDDRNCWIKFSGRNKDLAHNEVLQFLMDSARNSMKAHFANYEQMFSEVELHDLIALGLGSRGKRDGDGDEMAVNMTAINPRPFILVRKHAVLISMGILRCIVSVSSSPPEFKPSELYLIFGPYSQTRDYRKSSQEDDTIIDDGNERQAIETAKAMQAAVSKLATSDHDAKIPEKHEQHIYRAVLTYVYMSFDTIVKYDEGIKATIKAGMKCVDDGGDKGLMAKVYEILQQFKDCGYLVSNDQMESLQSIGKELSEVLKSLSAHRQCLEEVLNQPVTMCMMSLTYLHEKMLKQDSLETNLSALLADQDLRHNARRIERILGSFLEKFKDLEIKLQSIEEDIDRANGQVGKASKDSATNVFVVNTCITIVATAISFCGYVTGAFGMNLDQTEWLQYLPGVFVSVCIATLIFIIGGSFGLIQFLVYKRYLPYVAFLSSSSAPTLSNPKMSTNKAKSTGRGFARLVNTFMMMHKFARKSRGPTTVPKQQ